MPDPFLDKRLQELGIILPPEMNDYKKILINGAVKYAPNNWMEVDGKCSDHTSMHDSMFHHLSESWVGNTEDKDSGEHPLLHLSCRALMYYTKFKLNIIHPLDE